MPCPTPGSARKLASPRKGRRKPLFLRSQVQVFREPRPTTHVSAKTRNATPLRRKRSRACWTEIAARAAANPVSPLTNHPFNALNACLRRACREAQGRRLTLRHSLPVGGSRLSLYLRRGEQTLSGHQLEAEMCRSGSEPRPLDGGTRPLWLRL